MKCTDKKYLLKEAQRTLDESDSTAAFCLCQRWILKDAIALLKEQEPIAPKRPKTVYAYEFACGNCEACVDLDWIVCPWCGRRIKWDDI